MSILNLIRPELLNTPVYIPGGEQAQYRLHANELPWSPLEKDSSDLNFYPAYQTKKKVQEQLAQRYAIAPQQLTLTRGSDDGIDLIIRLFLTAGQDALLQCPPTFPFYAFYVRLQQGYLINCPLTEENNFTVSIEQINNRWQPNCKIIMLCNPNNPTGSLISLELVAQLCAQYNNRAIIVVDEAYIEFANIKSASSLINQFDNLIVLRTLSKAYGLAGLRLGSIIAQEKVIEAINKITAPYSLANMTLKTASDALLQKDWFDLAIQKIRVERHKLEAALTANPLIDKVYPTQANFMLVKTKYAQELVAYLAQNKIAIRYFPTDSPLKHHLRITVGNEEQNTMLVKLLSLFTHTI